MLVLLCPVFALKLVFLLQDALNLDQCKDLQSIIVINNHQKIVISILIKITVS